MNVKAIVLLFVVTLFVSACVTATTSEGSEQRCPFWAGYDSHCDVLLWKDQIASKMVVDMANWSKARFTAVGGEMLIDEDVNIRIVEDDGDAIDYRTNRLSAGSYVVVKVDDSKPASFRLVDPHKDNVVNFIFEFVRPVNPQ